MKKLLFFLFLIHSCLSSFSQNIGMFNSYLALAASQNGKIIAVGQGDIGSGYMITSIPSISSGWSQVSAVAWQGEKFIVTGSKVMRFNPNGTTDASFGSGGVVTGMSGNDLEVLCSGKILVAGNGIERLMPNGSLDSSFGQDGKAAVSFSIIAIALAPDGKIYALGKKNIARFMPEGVPDPSFMQVPLPTGELEFAELAIQADGKPVVTGTFNASSVISDIALFRYGLNGALDLSFSGDGWLTLDMAQRSDRGVDVRVQNDGKIVVLGTGLLFQCPCPAVGNFAYIIARYNSDGTLDTGFGIPTTLPIYNISPPNSISFPGLGKTVMGSFLKAAALELYGDSMYVAGGTTSENKGQGTFVFLHSFHNNCSPLKFSSGFEPSIPPAYSYPQGVAVNTVYKGYAPASAITLTVDLPEGSYFYAWNTGASTPSVTVAPVSTTTYSVTITNEFGCRSMASTTIQAIDVRCGNGNDKVQICQVAKGSGKSQTICIASPAVAAHLKNGSYLGSCMIINTSLARKDAEPEPGFYRVKLLGNPASGYFTLDIQTTNLLNKINIFVYDASGSLRETRILPPNNRLDLGWRYPKGVYFVEVIQGSNKRLLRLVKL